MNIYHNRPTVADIRAMKACGQKISMLYVTTFEEAAAADAAGINMLSIEGRYMSHASEYSWLWHPGKVVASRTT